MAQGLHVTLVTMFSTQMVRFVQQTLLAVGGAKLQDSPLLTVMLLAQTSTGGTATTVTVWSQMAELLHESVINQVRVMTCGHEPLVKVLSGVMVILLPQQDEAVGRSKFQFVSHGTVLLVGQKTRKGMVQLVNSARKAVGEVPPEALVT